MRTKTSAPSEVLFLGSGIYRLTINRRNRDDSGRDCGRLSTVESERPGSVPALDVREHGCRCGGGDGVYGHFHGLQRQIRFAYCSKRTDTPFRHDQQCPKPTERNQSSAALTPQYQSLRQHSLRLSDCRYNPRQKIVRDHRFHRSLSFRVAAERRARNPVNLRRWVTGFRVLGPSGLAPE